MLVANPAASQFTGGDHRTIVALLRRRHLVEAVWPTSAADARTIAADAITAGFDGVVAMGGDGIVHQVAQALVGTDTFLGVIPAGTTNVFARQIGLAGKPVRIARHLAADPHLSLRPTVAVDATDPDGKTTLYHSVFALGIGIDADIVAIAETEPYRKYRFGAVHYARISLGLLWSDIRQRRPNLVVSTGDRSATPAVGVMAQFQDAFTYFGRRPLRFEPDRPDPMTLLVVGRLPMRRLPALLRRMAAGSSLAGLKDVQVWPRVDAFDIDASPPTRFEIDGELIGELASARITFRPESLLVAGPQPRRR